MNLQKHAIALCVLALTGCTSTGTGVFNPCSGRTAGWQLSAAAPANQSELLALDSDGRPVGERLIASIPLREVWFADGSDRLMVCRYEVGAEVCPLAMTVEFTRTSTGWSAGPVESRTCAE